MNKTTKRRTEITIETHEIKTIRIRSLQDATFCAACGKKTISCAPEHVATILQVNLPDILRSIDDGRLHLSGVNGTDGEICVSSLEHLVGENGSDPPAKIMRLLYEPDETIC
jgi:hypothetical protein